ncbi:MAG: aminopeptidase [Burkholderiales bacterium PBB1]|nr:MAG: aminopeptidase [Burkholderiales bacterium PBB1]
MIRRRHTLRAAVVASLLAVLTSGCSSVGYYAQSVSGHLKLLNAARPVSEVLTDPATPDALKARLVLSQRIRDYAVTALHLPDNASYRRYADVQRSAAVWNVAAAPELSLTLRTWCFPVVGCVAYRGYYEREQAEAEAKELRASGLDAGVYPVPAYSTLGKIPGRYFADPLLNTFVQWPEGELARLIFHELAHQVAFAPDDTVFNESFATTVERVGATRWLAERGSPAARDAMVLLASRRADFRALTTNYRDRLNALYLSSVSDDDKRRGKAELLAALRTEHATLKAGPWQGYTGYDAWFNGVNNASFGMLAAYTELVPQFERLLAEQGGDLPRFYAEVQRLAALPMDERRRALLRAAPWP